MFEDQKSTVFILGAGASWHYGYPTGEKLVKLVARKAGTLSRYYEHSLKVGNPSQPKFLNKSGSVQAQWQKALNECDGLRKGLVEANPLVIDYFLGLNPGFQDVGKLLIAWAILECEHESRKAKRNINRNHTTAVEDDWCRFITHQLGMGCEESTDLLRNKVSFVTFNYDTSLETRLRVGLRHIQIFEPAVVEQFLSGSRITHVYGHLQTLSEQIWSIWDVQNENSESLNEFNWGNYHSRFSLLLDEIHKASTDLRVIDPHNKGADGQNIQIAQGQISDARRVFILGYGFDESNNRRLALSEALRRPKKPVSFTNFGDNNNVNKRASKLLMNDENQFRPDGPSLVAGFYERSTQNVYDALARDFDL